MSQTNDHGLVTPVNELSFRQLVLESKLPVLVDVSARWCPPCKLAAPVLADLASRYRDLLKVVEIDGEESPTLVADLGVRGFPTFVGISAGEIVARQAGFAGRSALERMAERLAKGS